MKLLRGSIAGILAALTLVLAGHPAYANSADRERPEEPVAAGSKRPDLSARIDQHLARLKSELKITPDQEQPWQAFSDQVKQQGQSMETVIQSAKGSSEGAPQTAPEQMHRRVEFMKQRLAGMEAVAGALDQLYAVLTPEQRAVADKHFARMHTKMRWRRG